ncbi:MAG: hypothetical protein JSV59_01625 [Flavobacteriaceae bacterium]|nr:MAG: hypothetical protein JSV59_01625 [Flavobacteriaceae bacterium]
MQTISKYFVAVLFSLVTNYVEKAPPEYDKQAGIHKVHIKVKKQYDCKSFRSIHAELKNYI